MLSNDHHLHDVKLIYKAVRDVFESVILKDGFEEKEIENSYDTIRTSFVKNNVMIKFFISTREACDISVVNEFGDRFGMITCVSQVHPMWSEARKMYNKKRWENGIQFEKYTFDYYRAFVQWDMDFLRSHFPTIFIQGEFPLQHQQTLNRFVRLNGCCKIHGSSRDDYYYLQLFIEDSITKEKLRELIPLIWESGYNMKFIEPQYDSKNKKGALFFYSKQFSETKQKWTLLIQVDDLHGGLFQISSDVVISQIYRLIKSRTIECLVLDETKFPDSLNPVPNYLNMQESEKINKLIASK